MSLRHLRPFALSSALFFLTGCSTDSTPAEYASPKPAASDEVVRGDSPADERDGEDDPELDQSTAAPETAEQVTEEATPPLRVQGVIVHEDGSPLQHSRCMVHKAVGAGYSIETNEGGVIANPTMETDEAGRFTVAVPRSFLPEERTITITCSVGSGAAQLADSQGVPLVLEVAPDLELLDLEKAVGEIVVGRTR